VTRTLQRLQHSGVLAVGDCASQLLVLERLEEHTDDFHVRHTSPPAQPLEPGSLAPCALPSLAPSATQGFRRWRRRPPQLHPSSGPASAHPPGPSRATSVESDSAHRRLLTHQPLTQRSLTRAHHAGFWWLAQRHELVEAIRQAQHAALGHQMDAALAGATAPSLCAGGATADNLDHSDRTLHQRSNARLPQPRSQTSRSLACLQLSEAGVCPSTRRQSVREDDT
jgi:hypothetical protein